MYNVYILNLACSNEFRIYVVIMTGEKLSSIYLAIMELIYWSVL